MDINMLHSVVTAMSFLCFLGIIFWAYSQSARKGFDEAAQLPFSEDDPRPEQGAPLNKKG
ncbi:cbb3-type cytochrome oxidase subunit 3 [Uliginosibacterium gangwonense]|uniref:cbb3-type cytochrome oxidase subunit 3 n=1 Tax=Uliginosibacterium gangwonense TaxID=392736 RepID=UPI00035DFA6F|nr:CcoQ/FixQ family Cbb3-type cytochrome c oxidase assembly chaperone [Uliginosibacterium gangwonense]